MLLTSIKNSIRKSRQSSAILTWVSFSRTSVFDASEFPYKKVMSSEWRKASSCLAHLSHLSTRDFITITCAVSVTLPFL